MDTENLDKVIQGEEAVQPNVTGDEGNDKSEDEKSMRTKQKVAEIGTQKRRMVVKAIRDDSHGYEDLSQNAKSTKSKADKKPNKRQKVKLSFDEDAAE